MCIVRCGCIISVLMIYGCICYWNCLFLRYEGIIHHEITRKFVYIIYTMEKSDQVERLLLASRNGDLLLVTEILSEYDIDVNCKGKHKSNLGWSPLHLATYFGHQDVVEELLQHGADVNIINGMGDTPLHRAAFTGRTNVVLKLLYYNADVSIINGEGRTPLQMTDNQEVKQLIEAAEKSQQLSRNEALLHATTEGDIKIIKSLLSSSTPPNINCQNLLGNTALHCAAYRGHKEIAVLLLQNGIDSTVKNNRGLSALEVARDTKMRQLLDVQPLQAVQKTVQRFEGYVVKKSRFLGWKKHWVVLERGILSAFQTRADASSGLKRQFFKYLDNAKISAHHDDEKKFKIEYSDHTVHFFMTTPNSGQVNRQRWLNAVREHCAYSTHYTSQPHVILMDELDEDYLPLGSIEDAIKNAKAHQEVLEQQVTSLTSYFNTLPDQQVRQGTAATFKMKLNDVVGSSQEVCSTLNHCLTVLMQQEEVRRLQLQEEAEKRRVLEDALHVLATEHFVLEQSVRSHSKLHINSFPDDGEDFLDVFYDAPETQSECDFDPAYEFENNQKGSEDEKEASFKCEEPGQAEDTQNEKSLYVATQLANGKFSPRTREKQPKYRKKLPHTMHSRNEFSIWSVLKQCVGKDLSRITMPVIFNEPLSFLQRIAEYMDYVHILHKATNIDDPIERLLNIAVFMVSCNASTEARVGKPFNPLLGETYELVREDLDFKMVCEQVSHHPPVSALHVESGSGFELTMSMQPELKFWGKDIEVKPKGNVVIKIPKYGDVYTFSYVSSGLHNIIIGNLWIELYGICEIKNHTTGHRAIINFKPAGWFGKDMNQLEGYIVDEKNAKKKLIKGDWTKYCCFSDAEDAQLLKQVEGAQKDESGVPDLPSGVTLAWKVRPKPSCTADMYMMTEFAMGLNHLLDEHKDVIAPTDCRYRPDIRCLENGDIEGASAAKLQLEEKQRATRRRMNNDHEVWETRWFNFEENEYLGTKEWQYNGEYFKRQYSKCPDIY
ncbi:oxysterol-binding protein-related protein 1-like [Hydractinia symbiolongicarpus]|uniref:oxysterol-binding protein-related protein 1-like n=1 Tax=Hydractinia symbiolongicarpus TaxID=13093 RepID=UPI002551C3BB|nr:oxysterol-binding protein-related protein 1-like [Hydractinia symbiolongicarpus]